MQCLLHSPLPALHSDFKLHTSQSILHGAQSATAKSLVKKGGNIRVSFLMCVRCDACASFLNKQASAWFQKDAGFEATASNRLHV